MRVNTSPNFHFLGTEYMIANSALENYSFMVSAFKKPPLKQLPRESE